MSMLLSRLNLARPSPVLGISVFGAGINQFKVKTEEQEWSFRIWHNLFKCILILQTQSHETLKILPHGNKQTSSNHIKSACAALPALMLAWWTTAGHHHSFAKEESPSATRKDCWWLTSYVRYKYQNQSHSKVGFPSQVACFLCVSHLQPTSFKNKNLELISDVPSKLIEFFLIWSIGFRKMQLKFKSFADVLTLRIPSGKYTKTLSKLFLIQTPKKTSMLSLWKSIYLLLPSVFSRICTLVVAIIFPSLTTRAKLSWLPKSEFSFVSLALPEPETAEGQPCIPVTSFLRRIFCFTIFGVTNFNSCGE